MGILQGETLRGGWRNSLLTMVSLASFLFRSNELASVADDGDGL